MIRVAVTRNDDELVVSDVGGDRRNNVVALEPGALQRRYTSSSEQLLYRVKLRIERVGLLLALCFVLGGRFVAERLLLSIEYDDDGVGRMIAQQRGEHRTETEDGVGDFTTCRGHRVGEREERPIDERVAVEGHHFHEAGTMSPFKIDSATARIVLRPLMALRCMN